jgi:hypothetical protein
MGEFWDSVEERVDEEMDEMIERHREQRRQSPRLLSDLDPHMPPEPIVTGRTLLRSICEAWKGPHLSRAEDSLRGKIERLEEQKKNSSAGNT